jgi:ATP-binding cassette subfamily B (MDR/TAP) protein 1
MALEHSFHKRFTNEAHKAKRQATTAAWITSFGAAFAFGMPLFTQALMNYVGARFIRDGEMSFEAMLQVYTLILFAITFTGQLLGFCELSSEAVKRFLSSLTRSTHGGQVPCGGVRL